ncbi:TPA: hypothetical protein NJ322_005032 [Vibrio parahaemolyticus]|nr:hypothetical protein [Vibrio parahaemolyticus]HCG7105676.1 hypothetical protein [Vibrio parahaemolyticus]
MDDWKNRRRMAWIAFCSLLAIAFYALWKGDLSQGVVAVVTTVCITLGGIVAAYMGFATADAHSKRKTGPFPAQPGNHQKSGGRHYETR